MAQQQQASSLEDTGPTTTRVQVVVRVRPVLAQEASSEVGVSCSEDGSSVQVQLGDRSNSNKEQLPGARKSAAKSYTFDACLPGRTTQADVGEVCGLSELVSQALEGYNVTIFAFGQTGSGKTHTMVGPRLSRAAAGGPAPSVACEEEDGLLPRCLAIAYGGIEERAESRSFSVTTSCVELYNESVTDLLGPDKNKQLQVRKDERGGFRVDGQTQLECSTAGAALRAMAKALTHRHTRAHAMNEYSSRSHCLMTFNFASQEQGEGSAQGAQGGVRRHGRLVLVDLAGSERLKETGNTGRDAVRETGAINKSLFTLGQVLAALAARSGGGGGGSAPVHVPYRDSKLTQLLWDGLRGSGRVLMVACLNPLAAQSEESLNTLHFASMALRIKAQPVMYMDPQDALVLELRNTIKQLQVENKQLAHAMNMISQGATPAEVFAALPEALRLAAARDGLGSAPAGAGGGLQGTGAQRGGANGNGGAAAGVSWPSLNGKPARGDTDAGIAPGAKAPALAAQRSDAHLRASVGGPLTPPASYQQQLFESLMTSPINYTNYSVAGPVTRQQQQQQRKQRPQQAAAASQFPAPPPPPAQPAAAYAGSAAPYGLHASHSSQSLVPTGSRGAQGGPGARAPQPNSLLGPLHPAPGAAHAHAHARASSMPALPPPPPLIQLGAFPELAALEAQFQSTLGGGAPPPADADADQPSTPPEPEPPKPEPKALSWAERNTWFGAQPAMTEFAYEVHDDLVDVQKMDAASDAYYEAIERRVKERFPEEWAAWEAEAAAAAAAALAAQQAAKLKPAPPPRPAPLPSHNFAAALRVGPLKDPLPWEHGSLLVGSGGALASPGAGGAQGAGGGGGGGLGGLFSPQRGLTNPNMAGRSRYNAGGAAAGGGGLPSPTRPSLAPSAGKQAAADSAAGSGAASPAARSRRPSNARNSTSQAARRAASPLLTTSLSSGGALHAPGSPARHPAGALSSDPLQHPAMAAMRNKLVQQPLSVAAPVFRAGEGPPTGSKGWNSSPTRGSRGNPGTNMLRKLDVSIWNAGGTLAADVSMQALQQEYLRQRTLVLDELRRAKADAEAERARILAKIGRTLGNSRWRA